MQPEPKAMTTQAARRLARLEAMPAPARIVTHEEVHAENVATAARCGFTEAQVMAQFGGWPAFAYARMTGQVVDPTKPEPDPSQFDELLAKHGGDGLAAYMEMLGVGSGVAR
jgi:hypothetical protein